MTDVNGARQVGPATAALRRSHDRLRVLTELLTRDGYTVEIKRPMVIVKPAG